MAALILVVEDHVDSREILSMQLKGLGYEVIEAESGEEGVEKAQEKTPNLIIMDLGLPGIDGIEATIQIKRDPKTAHIPVIAHTAWSEQSFRQKAEDAGIAEFLTKPTPHYRLRATVEKILNGAARPS